jgi:bleomycin hydrolase
MHTSLNDEVLAACRATFAADPVARIARNAIAKTPIKGVALNRDAVVRHTHTYSHTVKTGKATAQNASGRCWLFAGLNLFRTQIAEKLKVDDFELSQNYLMFWDKLEKANYFLENILATLDEPIGSRLLDWLCASPLQDGGQWDMFAALVKKYGVVPKEVMPETESSSRSTDMNALITLKLRQAAAELRATHAAGASPAELRAQKDALLPVLYRMLATHLGEPPTEFLWQWQDKDKKFHRWSGVLSPEMFYEKYLGTDLDEMVCLIHCPQKTKSYNTLYTIAYLGNVVGGQPIQYLNVEMSVLKTATQAMIRDGKPVWFGCDVGKQMDRDLGLMDLELFEYEPLYGTSLSMDKAARLDYGQSLMTHAMVLTGVDMDMGVPRKWRVENSWGEQGGDKGFMAMTDSWFDEYMYEVAVEKKYLPQELLALLEQPLVPLNPWDPMGSLAASV